MDLSIIRVAIAEDVPAARTAEQMLHWENEIKPEIKLDGRTRRPPRDRFNAPISFLYSMLMNDCRSAIEAVGLDPQLGFLHAGRPGRAALALDLQEEFRSILADRLALTLINCGQVSAGDFAEREGGAVMLNDAGRRVAKVCEHVGQRVQKSVFECEIDQMQFAALERDLLAEIDFAEDNLRFYRITEPRGLWVKQYGTFRSIDFDGPLVV